VWFLQAPDPRFVIAQMWILFAALFAWGVQRQPSRWNWNAAMAGLGLALPVVAFTLLRYLAISGADAIGVLVPIAFVALWMVAFGCFRTTNPRRLAAVCLALALFQYGQHSARTIMRGHYSELVSMLWLNQSHLPHLTLPAPEVLETYSGLRLYKTDFTGLETPLPNTRYFNPYLQSRGRKMGDGFRNTAPDRSEHYRGAPGFSGMGYQFEKWEKDLDSKVPFNLLDLQKPFIDH
jgi:4-amino-4-deoxy-L-arabinose transferase-like glycosyltransferase